MQALGRIGELARGLCAAYAQDDPPGLSGSFADALDALCGPHHAPGDPPASDDALDAAVAEVQRIMER